MIRLLLALFVIVGQAELLAHWSSGGVFHIENCDLPLLPNYSYNITGVPKLVGIDYAAGDCQVKSVNIGANEIAVVDFAEGFVYANCTSVAQLVLSAQQKLNIDFLAVISPFNAFTSTYGFCNFGHAYEDLGDFSNVHIEVTYVSGEIRLLYDWITYVEITPEDQLGTRFLESVNFLVYSIIIAIVYAILFIAFFGSTCVLLYTRQLQKSRLVIFCLATLFNGIRLIETAVDPQSRTNYFGLVTENIFWWGGFIVGYYVIVAVLLSWVEIAYDIARNNRPIRNFLLVGKYLAIFSMFLMSVSILVSLLKKVLPASIGLYNAEDAMFIVNIPVVLIYMVIFGVTGGVMLRAMRRTAAAISATKTEIFMRLSITMYGVIVGMGFFVIGLAVTALVPKTSPHRIITYICFIDLGGIIVACSIFYALNPLRRIYKRSTRETSSNTTTNAQQGSVNVQQGSTNAMDVFLANSKSEKSETGKAEV